MRSNQLKNLILSALSEDIGRGDVTSKALIPPGKKAKARIIAKENGVVAGLPLAHIVFKAVDKKIKVKAKVKEGEKARKGRVVAIVDGPASSILTAERTALNFLQRMSGIATLTAEYVKKVRGLRVKILDTRKTAPGLRLLDKYAVSAGGGINHRMGLFDAVLIKDNHIAFAGGIKKAVKIARENISPFLEIEVEAGSLKDVSMAIDAGADKILLDNMDLKTLKRAVKLVRKFNDSACDPQAIIRTEASGGVTLENVRKIAETGVDYISVGALTHSPKALDISLDIF